MELIGIQAKNDPQSHNSDIIKRFVVPVATYRNTIASRIKNLRPDSQITVNERKHSCFGQALHIALCLAEVSPISTRVVCLVGNPCTVGPGVTISPNFKEQLRSPK